MIARPRSTRGRLLSLTLTFSLLSLTPDHANTRATNAVVISWSPHVSLQAASTLAQPSGVWMTTGSTQSAHLFSTAIVLPNGKVLVAGAYPGTVPDVELYDSLTGIWSPTGAMIHARFGEALVLLHNGLVLAAGGSTLATDHYVGTATAELYDPATGSWRLTGSMLTTRDLPQAVVLNDGRVLVVGGDTQQDAEVYDPSSETWSATDNLSSPTNGVAVVLHNGKVLLLGGYDQHGTALNTVQLYNPLTNHWSYAASMNTARSNASFATFTATVLEDGRVLVAGATSCSSASCTDPNAELYDPASDTWTLTANMNTPRVNHAATLLPDGRVLITGGYDLSQPYTTVVASAEIYDPSTGKWLSIPSMKYPHSNHAAVLLPNGQVLVASGFGTCCYTPSTTAELYTPNGFMTFNPSPLYFGNQLVGTQSNTRTITLINTSTITLSISSALSGTNTANFASSGDCAQVAIAPNDGCVVSFSFTPSQLGLTAASLVVTNTDTGMTQTVTLSGNGTSPATSTATDSATPLPTFTSLPTDTPSITATPTSTPTGTNTSTPTAPTTNTPTSTASSTTKPSVTLTNSPTATASNTATALPTSTATPVIATVATATMSPTALSAQATGKKASVSHTPAASTLIVQGLARIFTNGDVAHVIVKTAPKATISVALQVLQSRTVWIGKGHHRHRTTQTVVLFQEKIQGKTNSTGRFTGYLRITFSTKKAMAGRFVITTQVGHGKDAVYMNTVTIQPHVSHPAHRR